MGLVQNLHRTFLIIVLLRTICEQIVLIAAKLGDLPRYCF
jgi:hypothetical protein